MQDEENDRQQFDYFRTSMIMQKHGVMILPSHVTILQRSYPFKASDQTSAGYFARKEATELI